MTLDGVSSAAKEMDLEQVWEQDGKDSDGGYGNVQYENIAELIKHGDLVEPRPFLKDG
jgi:hypothetical protein